jgi:Na+-driven multidrug efflux pump
VKSRRLLVVHLPTFLHVGILVGHVHVHMAMTPVSHASLATMTATPSSHGRHFMPWFHGGTAVRILSGKHYAAETK